MLGATPRLSPRRRHHLLRLALPHRPSLSSTQFLPSLQLIPSLVRPPFLSPCRPRSTPCRSRTVCLSLRRLCTQHSRPLLRIRPSTATILVGIPSASTHRCHPPRGLRRSTACRDRHHLSPTRMVQTATATGWATTDEEAVSVNLLSPPGSLHASSTRPAGARMGN